ncbi:hypothetical protein CROQUDRAFT_321617 [Cronartium quercuum f. sp. fusiforme G11]|uniref:Uncharacterized protein n=1 Tax=Cronartium quercuum f. sp. fusiforme G11 TaxID=708437 RepID=A0A9P6NPY9_9BASI|nr:hypothetical protein CROQUDRAFT_321617 [Cronartium quercuum f. sp. fusiforme G11]
MQRSNPLSSSSPPLSPSGLPSHHKHFLHSNSNSLAPHLHHRHQRSELGCLRIVRKFLNPRNRFQTILAGSMGLSKLPPGGSLLQTPS